MDPRHAGERRHPGGRPVTFQHIHDAAEFLMFRARMERAIDRIASRHLAALRRTWQTQDFLNRSAAQKRRRERESLHVKPQLRSNT